MAEAMREEMLALADKYESGTAKCVASGYEEFGPDFQRERKMVVDSLRSAAIPNDVRAKTIEECAKVADNFAVYESRRFDLASKDEALTDNGRHSVQDRALARNTAAKAIAKHIRALSTPTALSPSGVGGETIVADAREAIARQLAKFDGNLFDGKYGIIIAEHDKEIYRKRADKVLALSAQSARVKSLEEALRSFFSVLRQSSSFMADGYQLDITKADYEKALALLSSSEHAKEPR